MIQSRVYIWFNITLYISIILIVCRNFVKQLIIFYLECNFLSLNSEFGVQLIFFI